MSIQTVAQSNTNSQQHRIDNAFLSFVDLFSGAGGFSRGLLDSGHYTQLLGVDFEPDAIATYRENIGDGWCANVRHKHVLDELPACDVLIGSPPCQGFSVAGKKRGEKDERNGWPQFFVALRRLQPQAFIAENVDRLTHKPCQPYFNQLLTCAKRLGYIVTWRVLDAADYGVPQHRKRVFLVGFRSPECARAFSWPLPTNSTIVGLWTYQWVSAADALLPRLAQRAPDPKGLPNWLRRCEVPQGDALVHGVGVGGSRWQASLVNCVEGRRARHVAPLHDGKGYRRYMNAQGTNRTDGANWQPLDQPAFTITAASSTRHRVQIGDDVWKLDCGDLAALQGFPDDYRWMGKTVTSRSRQIGNAVPPPVAKVLGEAVAQALRSASVRAA